MGQRPGFVLFFFFCKKLINNSQLQNLFMIFLLGRGNSGGQRVMENRGRGQLAMEILGWML